MLCTASKPSVPVCGCADLRTVSLWAVVTQLSGMLCFNMATLVTLLSAVIALQASGRPCRGEALLHACGSWESANAQQLQAKEALTHWLHFCVAAAMRPML